ncbi:MAG TPA: hypothetical protein VGN72_14135 [Tepidisphaeraceae bacterium]|nr:hypothetical protein [Tepidisphaeraceae bacterium]
MKNDAEPLGYEPRANRAAPFQWRSLMLGIVGGLLGAAALIAGLIYAKRNGFFP